MTPKDVMTNPRVAGLVRRYHTWPVLTIQSVGEHSWQVYRIYLELFGSVPEDVAHYIMAHDMGELVAGDPPYPLKKDNKDLKKIYHNIEITAIFEMGHVSPRISKEESEQVKLCHMIEMMEFGLHEMTLGNQYARPIFERCQDVAQEMAADLPDPKIRKRALGHIRSAERRLA